MAVTHKIIEILKNPFKGIFLNIETLEIWKNFFLIFVEFVEYTLKPIVLAITKGKLAFLPKDNSNGEKPVAS